MKLSVYLQIFSTDWLWHCPSKVMIILTMRHPCTVLFLDKLLLYTANIRSTMMLNSAISDKPWKWICSSLSRKGAIFMAGKWRETSAWLTSMSNMLCYSRAAQVNHTNLFLFALSLMANNEYIFHARELNGTFVGIDRLFAKEVITDRESIRQISRDLRLWSLNSWADDLKACCSFSTGYFGILFARGRELTRWSVDVVARVWFSAIVQEVSSSWTIKYLPFGKNHAWKREFQLCCCSWTQFYTNNYRSS